jgi:hypothetical protein
VGIGEGPQSHPKPTFGNGGLPKLKDFPKEFGGSGEVIPE